MIIALGVPWWGAFTLLWWLYLIPITAYFLFKNKKNSLYIFIIITLYLSYLAYKIY